MKTPERTTAAAFPRYAAGEVVADSGSLQWKRLFVRRYHFPRVVDRFLVPATPEPLISCGITGSAEFREREIAGAGTEAVDRSDHLRENIGAIDVRLTPADLSEIETGISRLEIYGGRVDARQMAQIGQDA
jgi:hypothetical protein